MYYSHCIINRHLLENLNLLKPPLLPKGPETNNRYLQILQSSLQIEQIKCYQAKEPFCTVKDDTTTLQSILHKYGYVKEQIKSCHLNDQSLSRVKCTLHVRLDYQPLFGKMNPHSFPERGSKTGPRRRRKSSLLTCQLRS